MINIKKQINKEIFKLAIPNVLSNISIPLISTVDTILMGHLSAAHLGAVGTGAMIFNFIYWNFGFLRMGTTGITAQAFGSKNADQISDTLFRAVFTGFSFALLIFVFSKPLWVVGADLMNIQPQYYNLAQTYFLIRISAIPAAMLMQALSGWFFGMQNAVFPLVITIFINIINAIFSIWLVKGYNLGVAGVAWGTVIAQYSGLLLSLILIFIRYKKSLHFNFRTIFIRSELFKFLRINRDIFIRTISLTFVFFFFYSQATKLGSIALASSVILMQFLNWMQFGVDGFAYASESLVGKYLGAKNFKALNFVIKFSFIHAFSLGFLFSLGYYFFGDFLLAAYTTDVEVIKFTQNLLLLIAILPMASVAGYLWDGVFIGLTAAKSMRNTMLFSVAMYLLLFYTTQNYFSGIIALWLSLLVFMFVRGITQTLLFFKNKYQLN